MSKFIKMCLTNVCTLVSVTFMFIPESLFEKFIIFSSLPNEINIIINRILFSLFLAVIVVMICAKYIQNRKKVIIKGKDYIIEVKYGDINEEKTAKK